jgi:hypothetical protein
MAETTGQSIRVNQSERLYSWTNCGARARLLSKPLLSWRTCLHVSCCCGFGYMARGCCADGGDMASCGEGGMVV